MKKLTYLAFAILFGSIRLEAAQSAQDIYKEALMQEMTVRDLSAAVSLYEKVATDNSAPRSLRAQSYLRLGLCQKVLGKPRDAAAAWENVTANFSDQSNEHREALMHRQALEMEERPVERIIVSSPIIQVVNELKPTKWEWQFYRLQVLGNTRGELSTPLIYPFLGSLAYFYKPNHAIGMKGFQYSDNGSSLGGNDIDSVSVFWRYEKPVFKSLRPFISPGIGGYRVRSVRRSASFGDPDLFQEKYTTPGLNVEAGFTLGFSKGFALTLGYEAHVMARKTKPLSRVGSNWSVEKERGYRMLHGPTLNFAYRW